MVLEQVCSPVRKYLQTREDTVRCIVASLTDDSSNDLADVREIKLLYLWCVFMFTCMLLVRNW